jgi:AmmeMemoRadiSam system protein A
MISREEQRLLLQLARKAIQTTLLKGRPLPGVQALSELLRGKRGVFVTLWMEGELRGCVGFPWPSKPLIESVQRAAIGAAFQDPRFPSLLWEELSHLEIEISVLSVLRPIKPSQVKVGVHGLLVRKGRRSGLLLPQVAMEYRWDKEVFLEQTCVKAGFAPGTSKEKIEIFSFEAQIFNEADTAASQA